MIDTAQDYVETVLCRQCHAQVRIRVPAPLQASFVLAIFSNELGGLCEKCLKERSDMKELAILFAIVRMLEGNVQGIHPDGVSYGPAGITQDAVAVVNLVHNDHYTLKDMDDPVKAADVFNKYTVIVCTRNRWPLTPENRLRAWHPTRDDYVERGMNLYEEEKGAL